MDALSFAGRAAAAWTLALAAGFIARRVPALGLLLGALGWGYALWRRRLPPGALLAGLGSVCLAAVLPWAALARDPFQALPASAAWPVAAVAWAMLGAGAAAWTRLGARIRPSTSLGANGERARGAGESSLGAGESSREGSARGAGESSLGANGEAVLASPLLRRALLLELGALALLLPVSIAGTQIALGLATATLLFAYASGARPRLATPLDLPVAALLAAAATATAFSATPTSPLIVTALRTLIAFYVVTRALAVAGPADRELGRLLAIWAGASALVSALAFAQHWSGFDAVAALGLRLPVRVLAPESPGHLAGTGAFASRLTFAHATLVTLATLLGLQLAGVPTGKRQGWLWAAVALETAGLWSTFARAAWFALVAVGAGVIGLAGWAGGRARALRGLALLAAAVVLLFALSPGARTWGRAGLRPSENNDRLFLWARAAQVALDHPVLGVGFGSYHLVLGPYYDRYNPKFRMRTWAHDMPLSILCETGPLGLFAFLWLLVEGAALAFGALRRPKGNPLWRGLALGGALATVGFAGVAAFHDVLYDGQVGYNLFFSLGLAAWAAVRLAADSEIETPPGLH